MISSDETRNKHSNENNEPSASEVLVQSTSNNIHMSTRYPLRSRFTSNKKAESDSSEGESTKSDKKVNSTASSSTSGSSHPSLKFASPFSEAFLPAG